MKVIIAWIKELYLLANADLYYCRKGGPPIWLEETNNNNTCVRRRSQYHNAHLS